MGPVGSKFDSSEKKRAKHKRDAGTAELSELTEGDSNPRVENEGDDAKDIGIPAESSTSVYCGVHQSKSKLLR